MPADPALRSTSGPAWTSFDRHDLKDLTMPHPSRSLAAVAAAALVLSGCEAHPGGYEPAKPKPPPNYRAPEATAVDADLQVKAGRRLQRGLTSPDELVRAHALEVIGDFPPADPGPLVLPLLVDSSLLVRKAAAMTAGRLKLAAAHDRLLAMAVDVPKVDPLDPNQPMYAEQTRMAAIFALHQLGDTRYSHHFEQSAIDPRPQVRGDTALIFELIGDTSAKPQLTQMLKHDHAQNVRLQAAEALWKMGDEAGENFLIASTLSGFASDNMIALLALAGPRDRRVLGHVQGFIGYADYPQVALAASRAAGQLRCDWGVGVAESAAEKGDPMQKGMAALALGDIGRTDTQPTLAKLLDDDNPDVRVAAAAALIELGKKRQ